MGTESNQSNEDRYQDASQEEERQRTGLFRWDEPQNLMPPWSVPPGLLVPGPRLAEADATPSRPAPAPAPTPATSESSRTGPAPELGSAGTPAAARRPANPDVSEPAAGHNSWPGVALPAGWFLRAQPPSPAARAQSGAVVRP